MVWKVWGTDVVDENAFDVDAVDNLVTDDDDEDFWYISVVGTSSLGIRLSSESCPQQLPNRNPSAQVPRCFPSVLIHSQTNMQVPASPIVLWHCWGRIWRHVTIE